MIPQLPRPASIVRPPADADNRRVPSANNPPAEIPVVPKVPALIAHRGYPARFPENTLPGIEAALDAGARCVEFDLQLSADGVPLVIHDDNLRRTAGIECSVLDTPAAELRRIAVGEPGRFGDQFRRVSIPTLAETLALIADRDQVTAFVEIKRASLRRFGHERVLAPVLAALRGHEARCVAISFDDRAVAACRDAGLRIGWAFEQWNDAARRRAETLAPDFLFCEIDILPAAQQPLWTGPWRWVAYQTCMAEVALTLAARGIGIVETDDIGAMRADPRLAAQPGIDG